MNFPARGTGSGADFFEPYLNLSTDVGPVIDDEARQGIDAYAEANAARVLHRVWAPRQGHFIAPLLMKVNGIDDLDNPATGEVKRACQTFAEIFNRIGSLGQPGRIGAA